MAKVLEVENSNSNTISRICSGTEIVGNIVNANDIRIDGIVKGNISAKSKIVIGETGYVQGELNCVNADIMGKFEGKIIVKELLSLKSTADVKGDIIVDKIMIETGASFVGTSKKHNTQPDNKVFTTEPEEKEVKNSK